jgi:serine/threonine protein kinase
MANKLDSHLAQGSLQAYFAAHKIKPLLNVLLEQVVLHRPDDVLEFMIDLLETDHVMTVPPKNVFVRRNTLDTKTLKEEFDEASGNVVKVNQYTLGRLLGRGGFAEVYLAFFKTGLSPVPEYYAIKVVNRKRLARKRLGRSSNALILLAKEIAVWKKLVHPNLVNLVEVIDDHKHDHVYLVAELMSGGTVMEDEEPLPLDIAKRYIFQLLKALVYLHAHGIAHRDVKPGNMLLSEHGVMKLTDFGVSQLFDTADMNDEVSNTAGTPHFMSPEMCDEKSAEKGFHAMKSDIWAAGISLYMMVVGRPPFKARNIPDLFDVIVAAEIDYSHAVFKENPVMRKCVQTMLTIDPDQRPVASACLELEWFNGSWGGSTAVK